MFDTTYSYDFGSWIPIIIYLSIGVIVVSTIIHILWIIYQNKLMKESSNNGVLLKVLLEKDSEVTPFEISQMWTSFHSYLPWYKRLKKSQDYFSFEISSTNHLKNGDKKKLITFNFWVPEDMVELVEERLKATYRYCEVERLHDDYIPTPDDPDLTFEAAELTLREDNAFSIKNSRISMLTHFLLY